MTVATLAQAFCNSRWYVTSSIIGASNMNQLEENINSFETDLSEEVLKEIDMVHYENKDVALGSYPPPVNF